MIKTKQLYAAYDQYGDEQDPWYNYFLEIGDTMKYLSIEPGFKSIDIVNEPYDQFEEYLLDHYEFEEVELDNKQYQYIIKGLFK